MPHTYVLEREQLIPRPLDEVFGFFANAENLDKLTPPWLHFRFVTPLPIEIRTGTIIEYRLRLYGVPLSWRTRIESFEPGVRFVDVQERGPYRRWHHLHEFRETPDGTHMLDRIEYEMPYGPLGTVVHALSVQNMLRNIFDYRRERTAALLGATREPTNTSRPLAGLPDRACAYRQSDTECRASR